VAADGHGFGDAAEILDAVEVGGQICAVEVTAEADGVFAAEGEKVL